MIKRASLVFALSTVLILLRGTLNFLESQSGNVKPVIRAKIKNGTLLPSGERYSYSPFLIDDLVNHTKQSIFYKVDEQAVDIADEFEKSARYYVSRPGTLKITAKLKAKKEPVRIFLYNDYNQIQQSSSSNVVGGILEQSFEIPSAGIYRVNLKSHFNKINDVILNFELNGDERTLGDYVNSRIKSFEIEITPGQERRLDEIRAARRKMWKDPVSGGVRWQRRESPKERVVARVRTPHQGWSVVTVGLSGRNTAHYSQLTLPSLDLEVVSGELPYGLKKFKLYTPPSKGSGGDMVHESILRDQGLLMPRGDMVKVKLNGGTFEYMELLEGMALHMFEYAQKTEGSIQGYDVDELIAKSFSNRLVEKNYYKKIQPKDSLHGRFSTLEFAKHICGPNFLTAITYALTYAGNHGLGQADMRFHSNLRKNCLDPMIRDFNSKVNLVSTTNPGNILSGGLIALGKLAPNWRPAVATHGSYFVHRTVYSEGMEKFYWWLDQNQTLNFFELDENFKKAANYFEFWGSEVEQERVQSRMRNFRRAARLIKKGSGERPLVTLLDVTTAEPLQTSFKRAGIRFGDKYPLTGSEKRVRELIREASKGEVAVSESELEQLRWRNGTLAKLAEKALTGKDKNKFWEFSEVNLKNVTSFLFRREEAERLKLFFIQRALASGAVGQFYLTDENSIKILPTHIIGSGSETKEVLHKDLLLSQLSSDERVQIFYFDIPKTDEHMNLKPMIAGAYSYLGTRDLVMSPRTSETTKEYPTHSEEFMNIEGNILTPKSSVLEIDKPLIIPKGYELRVQGDTDIRLGRGGCFVIQGQLKIAEDARLKLSGDRWQGMHFHGNDRLDIRNMFIEGIGDGSETVECLGRQYTGGISFFDTSVTVTNSSFSDSKVEDAVHFLRSDVNLRGVKVDGAQGDAIDADFSYLQLDDIDLSHSQGDGLDVSGSFAKVSNARLHDNSDKDISVGENANVMVISTKISDGNIGIAVKDSSKLYISKSEISRNNYGIASFVKKPYFTEPDIEIAESVQFSGNGVDRQHWSYIDALKQYH